MSPDGYSESLLYEQETAFAQERGLPAAALAAVRDIRRRLAATDLPVACRLSVWVVAPVLAGFASWAAERIGPDVLPVGVLREGRFLCRILRALRGLPTCELALNRHIGLLAAYACGDDEALVNWLTRARIAPLTHAGLAAILPLDGGAGANQVIDIAAAHSLVAGWRAQGEQAAVWPLAAAALAGFGRHWASLRAARPGQSVALIDLACAGNIQRALQTVLAARHDRTAVLGLNLATTRGVVWAQRQGCEIRGFLAEGGAPGWIGDAYGRAPELMEIFAAAPHGRLTGYDAAGGPLWDASHLTPEHLRQVADWQDHILPAAKLFHDALGDGLTADLCRCVWGRFILAPAAQEAAALANWPLDAGLDTGLTPPRTLAPALTGDPQNWTKLQTAWPAASSLRRGV